jgi:trehalose 6-phosphate phosphatase
MIDRFQAVPWPGVRDALNKIQAQGRTRLAIITGRPAHEIAPLLALNRPVDVWGLHGFERIHADGRRERESISVTTQKKLDELHESLQRDSLGGLFEHKPNAAVMHWRGLSPDQAAIVEQRTRALFEPVTELKDFRLLPFEAGVELRVGRDKGGAVAAILEEFPNCAPGAYLGDDLTDEAAFRAIKRRGLSALVRLEPRDTAADVWLKPPQELLEFLECWLKAVQC